MGKYYTYNNNYIVCAKCHDHRPRCVICNKPVGSYYTYDDNYIVCKECDSQRPRCKICNKPVGTYYTYNSDYIVCKSCDSQKPRCEICNKPVGSYYTVDSSVYCQECYSICHTCSICKKPTGSYTKCSNLLACKQCFAEITSYKIKWHEARKFVKDSDLKLGIQRMKKFRQPHLCDVSDSDCIQKLSRHIASNTNSKFEYLKECYYLCEKEITYILDGRFSPIECLLRGQGNCSSKSGLLASLLKTQNIPVNLCELKEHVFVAAYLPEFPEWCRMFTNRIRTDGSNWNNWIGLDPAASNCVIGVLPDEDFTKISLKKF